MKRIIFVPLVLIAAIIAASIVSTPAHAQFIGTVCIDPAIAQATAPTGCSTSPVALGGTQFVVGSKFTLEVDLAGSDIMNGFEVAVMTDPTVLNPASTNASGSATLINTIGGSPFPLVNCINGAGMNCVTGIDGPGVAHLSEVALGGLSTAPTTGRLMYVTYNVMGLSSGSPVGYVVTTPLGVGACAGSSNSTAAGDTCVFVANGGGGFDTENVQTATFANQAPKDNTSTSLACSPSTVFPGALSTCTATVADTTTPSNTSVGTVAASCTLVSGSCTAAFTGVAPGTATVTGTYSGDTSPAPGHNGSTGTSGTITVVKDDTSTSVGTVSCNIALGGISCTASVTATVADTTTSSSTPTGTVTFTLTAGTTGGSLSGNTCTLSAGSCSVTFTGTAAGTGSVTASYGGASTHNTSASSAATV